MSSSAGLLRPGETVDTWECGDRVGQGTFSEIYAATHSSGRYRAALKVDRPGPRPGALQWESDLLLKLQKYPMVPRHYGFFTAADGKTKVLAMQLLGNNVSGLRRKQPDGSTLPFATAIHLVLQMLAATEAVHQEGFIHRDLKPSNFVHGAGRVGRRQLFVLDFGQSRMYLTDKGDVRPARDSAEFRGTSLYSSVHAHLLHDLGRRDDLWSLFYCLIDMIRGGLPWRPLKDERKKCEVAKQYYQSHPRELVAGLPGEESLLALQEHLLELTFEAKPDYFRVARLLKEALQTAKLTGRSLDRQYPPYPPSAELKDALSKVVFTPKVSAPGVEEGEVASNALSGEAGTGVGHTGAPLSADRAVEDDELANVFDQTDITYTADCVLESRGGAWGAWERDKFGSPIFLTLQVDASGMLTPLARSVAANFYDEGEACYDIIKSGPVEEEWGVHSEDEDSAGESGTGPGTGADAVTVTTNPVPVPGSAAASLLPLVPLPLPLPGSSAASGAEGGGGAAVAGRKRRRPEELDYAGRSDTFIARDLVSRLSDLKDDRKMGVQDTPARTTFVLAWKQLATAALKAYARHVSAEFVAEDIRSAMFRLLEACDEGSWECERSGDAGATPHKNMRFFQLPTATLSDKRNLQLCIARLEEWVATCGHKPAPLAALTSLQETGGDVGTSLDEKRKHEKELRKVARERYATLVKLCSAIARETEMVTPLLSTNGARATFAASSAGASVPYPSPSASAHPPISSNDNGSGGVPAGASAPGPRTPPLPPFALVPVPIPTLAGMGAGGISNGALPIGLGATVNAAQVPFPPPFIPGVWPMGLPLPPGQSLLPYSPHAVMLSKPMGVGMSAIGRSDGNSLSNPLLPPHSLLSMPVSMPWIPAPMPTLQSSVTTSRVDGGDMDIE